MLSPFTDQSIVKVEEFFKNGKILSGNEIGRLDIQGDIEFLNRDIVYKAVLNFQSQNPELDRISQLIIKEIMKIKYFFILPMMNMWAYLITMN